METTGQVWVRPRHPSTQETWDELIASPTPWWYRQKLGWGWGCQTWLGTVVIVKVRVDYVRLEYNTH